MFILNSSFLKIHLPIQTKKSKKWIW